MGVSRPNSQPTHLGMAFDLSPFQAPSTTLPTPLHLDSYSLSFSNNNWVPIIFASWRKIIRHHPEMPRICWGTWNSRSVFACGLMAFTKLVLGLGEPNLVASTKPRNIWEAGGVWTETEFPCYSRHSLLYLLSPCLLLPLFQSSLWIFLPAFAFSPKCGHSRKESHRRSSYFTFFSFLLPFR